MAHYAFLDANNIVQQVIVGRDEHEMDTDWEQYYSQITGMVCKRTSYNTRFGVYYDSSTNQPHQDQSKSFRKNYAGIGYSYDEEMDAFIPPKPEFELLEYILEPNSATWIVNNVITSNIVSFIDNTYAYMINNDQSAVLNRNDSDDYVFMYSIPTDVVLNYITTPSANN